MVQATHFSGVDANMRRDIKQDRVGFAINTDQIRKISGLPKDNNDRLVTLRHLLSGKNRANIICAYAPTVTNPDDSNDKFYDDLDNIIYVTSRVPKLIL